MGTKVNFGEESHQTGLYMKLYVAKSAEKREIILSTQPTVQSWMLGENGSLRSRTPLGSQHCLETPLRYLNSL